MSLQIKSAHNVVIAFRLNGEPYFIDNVFFGLFVTTVIDAHSDDYRRQEIHYQV